MISPTPPRTTSYRWDEEHTACSEDSIARIGYHGLRHDDKDMCREAR